MLTRNPADTTWRSVKYRRFIRNHLTCDVPKCGVTFLDEPETYEAHHHKPRGSHGSTGGKNPSDQLLTPLCRKHHSAFHARVKDMQWPEEKWLSLCISTLAQYVESMNVNAQFVMLNALQQVAAEEE